MHCCRAYFFSSVRKKKAVKVQFSCIQKGKNAVAYAVERLVLQETFLKLKIRGL